jgi:serine protease AprX
MHPHVRTTQIRRKAVWGPKRTLAALLVIASGFAPNAFAAKVPDPKASVKQYKLDGEISKRKNANPQGITSVIVTMVPGATLPPQFKKYARGNTLQIINGQVLDLPNGIIKQLEANPQIYQVHHNRPVGKDNYRTTVTVGSRTVNEQLGYTGAGVGIAVIDSGISAWHDDLTQASGSTIYPYGNQRVKKFVDFVAGHVLPYDDNGHGSHVSGIIAGNGYDSRGEKSGVAPNASLVSLKVLDGNGQGTISNIIAAFDWVVANHQTYNIRVINLSVGAKITESYLTDPLTLAAKKVVDIGVVVVAASGNFGKNAAGNVQYGGIVAPANAPWVLTVGASSTQGTLTRKDDVMASFSSNGPTYKDFEAKPDLVAPGTGTVSLAVPGSLFYQTKTQYLVNGKPLLGIKPYLTLSGTSMAAPVVTGTVALMLQANPNLTPNLVKAILQYTAEEHPDYSALRQGAGFLNSLGAVRLAKFYKDNPVGVKMPVQKVWSQHIIWGSHEITDGYINPLGNAWSTQIIWGAAHGLGGDDDNIVWGTECGDGCDNIVWGTDDADGDNIVWGTDGDDNIVWGTEGDDNIVWGTDFDGDNIVWGTGDDDNIVWGTDCGGADCDNIVWGTSDDDNIVWGTSADEDATWGSSGEDQVVFPEESEAEPVPDIADEFGEVLEPQVGEPTTGGGF